MTDRPWVRQSGADSRAAGVAGPYDYRAPAAACRTGVAPSFVVEALGSDGRPGWEPAHSSRPGCSLARAYGVALVSIGGPGSRLGFVECGATGALNLAWLPWMLASSVLMLWVHCWVAKRRV